MFAAKNAAIASQERTAKTETMSLIFLPHAMICGSLKLDAKLQCLVPFTSDFS